MVHVQRLAAEQEHQNNDYDEDASRAAANPNNVGKDR